MNGPADQVFDKRPRRRSPIADERAPITLARFSPRTAAEAHPTPPGLAHGRKSKRAAMRNLPRGARTDTSPPGRSPKGPLLPSDERRARPVRAGLTRLGPVALVVPGFALACSGTPSGRAWGTVAHLGRRVRTRADQTARYPFTESADPPRGPLERSRSYPDGYRLSRPACHDLTSLGGETEILLAGRSYVPPFRSYLPCFGRSSRFSSVPRPGQPRQPAWRPARRCGASHRPSSRLGPGR